PPASVTVGAAAPPWRTRPTPLPTWSVPSLVRSPLRLRPPPLPASTSRVPPAAVGRAPPVAARRASHHEGLSVGGAGVEACGLACGGWWGRRPRSASPTRRRRCLGGE